MEEILNFTLHFAHKNVATTPIMQRFSLKTKTNKTMKPKSEEKSPCCSLCMHDEREQNEVKEKNTQLGKQENKKNEPLEQSTTVFFIDCARLIALLCVYVIMNIFF